MTQMNSVQSSTPASPSASASTSRPISVSLVCIRITLGILIISLIGSSLYFSSKLKSLTTEIQKEQSSISSLNSAVQSQQAIVDRFSDSVTNNDVLQQVQQLKLNFQHTKESLLARLNQTEDSINAVLKSTVQELNQTVAAAEAQIHNEVDRVEGNVEKYVRTTQDQFSMENSFMVYQLAGTFTLLASLISMWHMTAHLRKFKRPFVQRKILAILWMSPIYGVTSWLSLVFPNFEGYLSIIKDFYEAYVIYQFLGFLISVLGKGNRDAVVDLLSHHTDHLDPPMRCFGWIRKKYTYASPRQLADSILLQCQFFCMQFVFLKPLTAIGMFTCNTLGYYGSFGATTQGDYRSPQFWILTVQNVSVFMAFSGLLKFYHAVQDDLAWCRPFPKFLCIKGIVFMTFWQGLVISILASTTSIGGGGNSSSSSSDSDDHDPDIWGKQAQNFLICLEMLLFSIAHFYCFPTEEWQEGYRPQQGKKQGMNKFGDNIALGDFLADLKLIMRGDKDKKHAHGGGNKKDKVDAHAKTTGDTDEDDDNEEEEEEQKKKSSGDSQYDTSNDNSASNDDDDDVESGEKRKQSTEESFDADEINETIQQSLDAPDADVREAANRLMTQINETPTPIQQRQQQETEEDGNAAGGYGATSVTAMGGIPNETDQTPGETTSLLNYTSTNNAADDDDDEESAYLRPSIFTTVDGMGSDFDYKEPKYDYK